MHKTNIMSEEIEIKPVAELPKVVKQIIVMRKDLKIRRGKEIAQGSHASIMWLVKRVRRSLLIAPYFNDEEESWMGGKFTKICVQAKDESELMEVYNNAIAAGLEAHLITDAGLTEFHGVPTKTCCAIGPHYEDKLKHITGHLSLY